MVPVNFINKKIDHYVCVFDIKGFDMLRTLFIYFYFFRIRKFVECDLRGSGTIHNKYSREIQLMGDWGTLKRNEVIT